MVFFDCGTFICRREAAVLLYRFEARINEMRMNRFFGRLAFGGFGKILYVLRQIFCAGRMQEFETDFRCRVGGFFPLGLHYKNYRMLRRF